MQWSNLNGTNTVCVGCLTTGCSVVKREKFSTYRPSESQRQTKGSRLKGSYSPNERERKERERGREERERKRERESREQREKEPS